MKYRVFVSYSHEDQELVDRLISDLEREIGFEILCDRNIGAGTPFTEVIKGLIIHAHIFIPVITKNSQKTPWVHQETGYAIARNIPVLPIVVEGAGLPGEMISQLQAICVKDDFSDLVVRLKEVAIDNLVLPRPPAPQEMIQVAEWPEQRTEWLTQYAMRILEIGNYSKLRQRGAYSSFCLPDKNVKHRVWKDRDGKQVRSDYYHHLQREERIALEKHARMSGCRLIIYPKLDLSARGKRVRYTRLSTLLEFLESMSNDKCEVITSEHALGGNLTIVGDWFVAESLAPRTGGYLQTVFNWHAPTALHLSKQFDQEFEELCLQKNVSLEKSLKVAIEEIKKVIQEDKAKLSRSSKSTPTSKETSSE